MSEPRNPDYKKYADDQVRTRELEDAIGRLRLALFLAVLGPITLVLSKFLNFGLPKILKFGVLATAPLAIVLLIVRFIQVPTEHKASKSALGILVMTVVAAMATFILAKQFSMFP